jgi:hypothetical protein
MPPGDIKRAVASALGKNVSSFNVFSGKKGTEKTTLRSSFFPERRGLGKPEK